jgi:hypothetical protein
MRRKRIIARFALLRFAQRSTMMIRAIAQRDYLQMAQFAIATCLSL